MADQLILDRLQANLNRLRLGRVAQVLDEVVQSAQSQGYSHLQVLDALLEEEVACKEQRRLDTTLKISGLPFIKTLDDFDFTFQPHLDRRQINSLFDLTFLSRHENVLLLGPPGVGKTHLAVVLDAYSRRCIGWALDRRIDASLCVEALRMALKCRMPPPGLVHHSDRGVQYASKEYTGILTEAGAFISMSRKANPYDNAYAESFMKTLKYEEVYLNEYQNLNEARGAIAYFLEDVYNKKRLHSALGYLPPAEFERNAQMLAASSGRAIAQAAMGQSLATESNA
jgi:hypothetical protein